MAILNAKSGEISAKLAGYLAVRLPALALVQSTDTDGYPLISIGAGTAGGANAIIKVLPQNWPLATDVFGNAANSYGPNSILVATEADSTSSGADPLTPAQLLPILAQVALMGTHIDWYQSASGTAPTAATFATATNLKASFDTDVYYPLISSQ
jgi:hypothetical protein